MNCEEAHHLFDVFLDGELTGSLATEFGAHRLRCAGCRRDLALLEVTGQVIATDAVADTLDANFTDQVVFEASRAPRSTRRWRSLWRVGAPSLAAAACLAFLISYLNNPRPKESTKVAGYQQHVTVDQLREGVESALRRDPGNVRLQEAAATLNAERERILRHTVNGANELENYGKQTIMEILDLIRKDATPQPMPIERASGAARQVESTPAESGPAESGDKDGPPESNP